MYQLYYDKENCILEIKPLKSIFKDKIQDITDEVYYHNDHYYFCKDRKALKEKALDLKREWLDEAENRLNKVENIKI